MLQLSVYLLQNHEMKTIQFQTFFREGTEQFTVKLTFQPKFSISRDSALANILRTCSDKTHDSQYFQNVDFSCPTRDSYSWLLNVELHSSQQLPQSQTVQYPSHGQSEPMVSFHSIPIKSKIIYFALFPCFVHSFTLKRILSMSTYQDENHTEEA